MEAHNFDKDSVVTPVDVEQLDQLLQEVGYDQTKTEFLTNGFKHGFDLGYQGPTQRRTFSNNLKLRVGNELELWNKVIKEVQAGRLTGPWEAPPYDNFIQSPIGLVPKHEVGKTRLIFHLSHPKGDSVNCHTPKEICSVEYNSFDKAVRMCLKAGKSCFTAKSDLLSAFRHLPIKPADSRWLVIKARHPNSRKWYYFCDKAVPFGSSRSCALFSAFSDALAAIFVTKARVHFQDNTIETDSYLDDFFFANFMSALCNEQVQYFIDLCDRIRFLVSMEKTVWATQIIVFLGILINTITQTLALLQDKVTKAKEMIDEVLRAKKVTVHELQKLTGLLNFFCRAIVPGRTFTRRLYYQFKQRQPYHHVKVNTDLREDLRVWLSLLEMEITVCRPFVDFQDDAQVQEICAASDASLNPLLGIGGYYQSSWFALKYPQDFIQLAAPSVQFVELLALLCTVWTWRCHLVNSRVSLTCDNQAVVAMINSGVSSERKCMQLIRLLTFLAMKHNIRIFAKWASTKENWKADLLSRLEIDKFKQQTGGFNGSRTNSTSC